MIPIPMIPIPLTELALVLAVAMASGPGVDAPAAKSTQAPPADGEAEAAAEPEAEAESAPENEGDAPPRETEDATETGTGTETETETMPLPPVEPEPEPEAEAEAAPEPEPEPEPPGPDPEADGDRLDPGYDPLRDSPEAIRARGWLRSGIVATSVGAGLGVAAILLGTLDPCDPVGGNSCFVDARNRAALSAGIPGAVLLTGGVAMLTVGAVRLKRMKSTLRTSASVHVDRAGAVVGVRGRF